ncbi:arginase family protein [Nonomuraea jiangxiensis]|uniref:Agmatinase n=1 Tax=Nonomuraea jiangxiensis TaxID=633440 RepID=A0A1G7ZZL3_9ACTN|nr:arginase family protein [Nonomuraea jiangxiensis]SDH14139.1 agmatinase [Nonomuraea jiangxiensis]
MNHTEAAPVLPVGTLFGVPTGHDLSASRLAVLGVPFDMGYHPTRIGARSGPAHVRAHSALVAEYLEEFGADLLQELGVVDLGDVGVLPGDVGASFPAIEAVVSRILTAGVVPLTLGGDGAVTLPQLRAMKLHRDGFAVLHFDAHTDAYEGVYPYEYNNANTFVHAVREGLIDPTRSMHVGMRDTEHRGHPGLVGVARDLGYEVVTMDEFTAMGVPALVERIRARFAGVPVYLCWDMDVFDPSVAPGVVTPTWGGISVREGLSILRGMRGLEFAAFDINTVSPPHDHAGLTGSLAAQVAMECLFLLDASPR